MTVTTPPDVGLGQRVGGRFVVHELIGRGGSAPVYRAFDELLGREVALKVFDRCADEERTRRRAREMRALAAVTHPGVVTVYDVGQAEQWAYIVMRLVRGGTLADRLDEGPLPLADVLVLGEHLCVALGHVHAHGVVHRDLKPGKVLLDDGRPLLADFGTASVAEVTGTTRGGDVVGTAGYLAPEQVRGEAVGPATDVYALGLVLLECLTGRREYTGPALEAAVARLHRRPRIPEYLPASVATLLGAMTADAPAARPGTAQTVELVRAIRADLGAAPTEALADPQRNLPVPTPRDADAADAAVTGPGLPTPPTPARTAGLGKRRRPSAAAAAVGLVVAMAVALSAVLLAAFLPGGLVPRPGGAVLPPAPSHLVPAPPVPTSPAAPAVTSTAVREQRQSSAIGAPVTRDTVEPTRGSDEPTAGPTDDPDEPTGEPTSEPTSEPPSPCPPGVEVCIPRGEDPDGENPNATRGR